MGLRHRERLAAGRRIELMEVRKRRFAVGCSDLLDVLGGFRGERVSCILLPPQRTRITSGVISKIRMMTD